MEKFATKATDWNCTHLGNIFMKRRLMARLNGIQKTMAIRPSSALVDLEDRCKGNTVKC